MSTGGAGGSNRDVQFTITVKKDGSVDAVIGELEKRFAKLQGMAQVRVGATGGGQVGGMGGNVGGGGTYVAGGGSSGPGSTSNGGNTRSRGAAGGGSAAPGPSSSLDSAFNEYERKWAEFEKKRLLEERKRDTEEARVHRDRQRRFGELRGAANEAFEGVTQLARAFVLVGVSGEENIEKALRAYAKFEAVVSGARGLLKIGNFAGKGLSLFADKAGIAAGAGSGGLGAAAVAAGVGVAGAGFAIADTIRYNMTGKIGGYSQTYANAATGLAGTLGGYGIDPRAGGVRGFASNMIPGVGLLDAAGFYGAASQQQATQRTGLKTLGDLSGRIQYDTGRLQMEKQILATMEQELNTVKQMTAAARERKEGAAGAYASLDPWNKGAALRLRNRFFDNPDSLNDAQLQAIGPMLGERENRKIQRMLRDRAGKAGLYDRGFQKEDYAEQQQGRYDARGMFDDASGLQLDTTAMKREYVIKFERENDQAIEQLRVMIEALKKDADDDFQRKLDKLEDSFNANLRRIESQRQGASNQTANALGG